jgi:uncharacterized membrane protein
LQVSRLLPRIVVGQTLHSEEVTVDSRMRYVGCATGFVFGLVWMTVGFGSALVCVFLAALGYGAAFFVERVRTNLAATAKPTSSLAVALEEFELENERAVEEVDDATSPLSAEAEYGWPIEEPEIVRSA